MQLNEISKIKYEIASDIGKFEQEINLSDINEICDDILYKLFRISLISTN